MYGRSEVRCCARVVIMCSDEVVSGDAPGLRREGRKGRRLFLRTCQAWRLPAFAPLYLTQAEAHADHIQDSTPLDTPHLDTSASHDRLQRYTAQTALTSGT
jgi:hypothetical protein